MLAAGLPPTLPRSGTRLCRAVPSCGPVLDRPFPVWGRFCSVRPNAWLGANEQGSNFGGETRPTEAEGGGSRGALRVVGTGALVQGAVLEAGGGECEVGFGNEAMFCEVGSDSAEDRVRSSGR